VLYALPPCGRCREFIRQLDPANLAKRLLAAESLVGGLPGGDYTLSDTRRPPAGRALTVQITYTAGDHAKSEQVQPVTSRSLIIESTTNL
jgi:hypothetical protein